MARLSVQKLQRQLLDWYAEHQRPMPWRALQGKTPDPYHVWLSEIMLQQTTVITVIPYFQKFIKRWATVELLANAEIDDVLTMWAGLGYYARARNLHHCAQEIVNDFDGCFPDTVEALIKLSGIGPYTAAAIASIAYNQQAVAVDGNVERVVSRFFAITEPLPLSKPAIHLQAQKLAKNNARPHDFTQAFMELGATVCTPQNPKCGECPWQKSCQAKKLGILDLPRKMPKAQKPTLYGKVFWIYKKDGNFLIEKRQSMGKKQGQNLYQGMYQLPTTEWVKSKNTAAALAPPVALAFKPVQATVLHSFTHFNLVLEIWGAPCPSNKTMEGIWVKKDNLHSFALPTLMQKVINTVYATS